MYNKIICCLFVISFICLTNAFATLPQTHPLPHDNSLSVYIGYQGTWYNYNTQTDEECEIEAQFASFTPTETIATDWATFASKFVNAPEPPEDWDFYYPVDNEPYQVHVVVQDTQARLGSAVVTDAINNSSIGTLTANAEHTLVDGVLTVPVTNEGVNVVIKSFNNNNLGETSNNPVGIDEISLIGLPNLKWKANSFQTPHQTLPGCAVSQTQNNTIGSPDITTGINLYYDPNGITNKVCSCMVYDFFNDSSSTMSYTPPVCPDLLSVRLVNDTLLTTIDTTALPLTVVTALTSAANNLRNLFLPGNPIFSSSVVPPYSKGKLHWSATLIGDGYSLVYVAFNARTNHKFNLTGSLQTKINQYFSGGGGLNASPDEIILQIGALLETEKEFKACKLFNGGSIYVLRATPTGIPQIVSLQPITEPVSFELSVDRKVPDGNPSLIGGNGTLTRGTFWTAVSPPWMPVPYPNISFPTFGPNLGKYSVELPKGWRWAVTGTPNYGWYTTASVPFETGSGALPTIQLMAQLNVLINLRVITFTYINGVLTPEASTVHVDKQNGTNWTTYVSDVNTTLANNIHSIIAPTLAVGHYRVRAKSTQGTTWTEWYEFDVTPDLLKEISINVTR